MSPSESRTSAGATSSSSDPIANTAVTWSTKDFLLLFSAVARVTTGPNHPDKSAQDKPMSTQSAQFIPWTTVKQLIASCPLASPHLQRASIAKLEWYYCQFIEAQPFGQGLSLHVILQVLFSRRLRELFNDIQSEDQALREELRELGVLPLPTPAQQLSLATGSTSNPHAAVPDALRSPLAAALTPLTPAITLSDGPLSPQVIPLGSPRPYSSFHSYMTAAAASAAAGAAAAVTHPSANPTGPSTLPPSQALLLTAADPMAMELDSPSVYLPHRPSQSFSSRTSHDGGVGHHGPRSTSVTPTPRSPSVFHVGAGSTLKSPPPPGQPPGKTRSASASGSVAPAHRRAADSDSTPRRPRSPPKLVLKSTTSGGGDSGRLALLNPCATQGNAAAAADGVPLPLPSRPSSSVSLPMDLDAHRPLALAAGTRRAHHPTLDPGSFPPPLQSPTAMTDASSTPSTPFDDRFASRSSSTSAAPPLPSSSSTGAASSSFCTTARTPSGSAGGGRTRRTSLKQADDRHRHWRKSCLRKWDDIADARLGHTFSSAIKADNAHNYRAVIRHPMDLKVVKQRLREGKTSSTDEFHRDLLLMMANARMYYGSMGDWKGLVDEMKLEIDRQLTEFRVMERMANARMGHGGGGGGSQHQSSSASTSVGSSAASSSADLPGAAVGTGTMDVVVKLEQGH